jgi:hypothetical protein
VVAPDAESFVVSLPWRPGVLGGLVHVHVELHFGGTAPQSGAAEQADDRSAGLCLVPPAARPCSAPSPSHEASQPARNWVLPGRSYGGLVDDLPVRHAPAHDAPPSPDANASHADSGDPVQLRPGEPAEVALDIRRRVGSVLAGSVFALDSEQIDDREFVRSFRLAAYESESSEPASDPADAHIAAPLVASPPDTHWHTHPRTRHLSQQQPSHAVPLCAACGQSPLAQSFLAASRHAGHASPAGLPRAATAEAEASRPLVAASAAAADARQEHHGLYWPSGPGQQPLNAEAIESLRRSAEQLEQTANLLERQGQYERADELRFVAQRLRLDARQWPAAARGQ